MSVRQESGRDATAITPDEAPAGGTPRPGEGWKLIAAWLVVGVPAAWGVAQVVIKSLALFQ